MIFCTTVTSRSSPTLPWRGHSTTAIMDRFTANASRIELKGESMRHKKIIVYLHLKTTPCDGS